METDRRRNEDNELFTTRREARWMGSKDLPTPMALVQYNGTVFVW